MATDVNEPDEVAAMGGVGLFDWMAREATELVVLRDECKAVLDLSRRHDLGTVPTVTTVTVAGIDLVVGDRPSAAELRAFLTQAYRNNVDQLVHRLDRVVKVAGQLHDYLLAAQMTDLGRSLEAVAVDDEESGDVETQELQLASADAGAEDLALGRVPDPAGCQG